MPSGPYLLKVTAAGFRGFVASHAQLAADQPLRIDARLAVGSTSSTVQVLAAERSYTVLENSAGTRTPSPLIQVPQSIEVLDHSLIRDQDRRTLADALVNVSGVTPVKPEEILSMSPIVRGFPAEIYTDGLAMFGNTTTANDPTSLAGTERIEVVKGPTSTMYGGGLGSPLGGLINVVSVRPRPGLAGYVGLRGGDFGTFDPYGDLNVPLNSRIAARFSGEYQRNDSWVDVVSGDHWSLQPAMFFQLGPKTDLFVQGRFNHRDQLEYSGVPAVHAMAGQIDRDAFVGAPVGQSHTRLDNRMATAELNHAFTDNLRWNASARYYFSQANEHGSAGMVRSWLRKCHQEGFCPRCRCSEPIDTSGQCFDPGRVPSLRRCGRHRLLRTVGSLRKSAQARGLVRCLQALHGSGNRRSYSHRRRHENRSRIHHRERSPSEGHRHPCAEPCKRKDENLDSRGQ